MNAATINPEEPSIQKLTVAQVPAAVEVYAAAFSDYQPFMYICGYGDTGPFLKWMFGAYVKAVVSLPPPSDRRRAKCD